MTTLLVIEASPRGEHSVSHNMTRRFVQDWVAAHPGGTIINRNLLDTGLRFVDAAWLQAYFTPPTDARDGECVAVIRRTRDGTARR